MTKARALRYSKSPMTITPLQGDLQIQVMTVMWRLEEATVDTVRQALPPRYRGAYTTIQTVLNRLVDRGLLKRRKVGNVVHYTPALSEAGYVSATVEHALTGASPGAREVVLARLIGGIDDAQLAVLRQLGKDIDKQKT